MAMSTPAMANPSLKVKPRLTMITQSPDPSRLKRSFPYTLPTSSSSQRLPLSLSLRLRLSSNHAALPISPVLKEHKGFGVNMNSSAFWALSFWDDLLQTDKKNGKHTHQPLWVAKEDNTVTETKDDTKAAKREVHKTKRRSGDKPNRKIYAVVIGASVCALIVFVLPKQQASRELLSRSMDVFNGALLACPLTRQLSYESTKTFLYEMLVVAHILISIRHMWYTPNGLQSHGKLRNRKPSKKQSVTFDDVEGVDEAKAELLEIVLCIKGDSKYMKLGAKLPRGVLLAGSPGTGKTLLAREVAGEADVAFFTISASELVEIFAGTGAARVRDLFWEARKRSPSIIFIDEIDAVGGQRGISFNSERDQTLNQGAKVVVIGATNRPGSLDSALIRPGRFSRKVVVGEPDEEGRGKIFGLYMKEVKMEREEDKRVICDLVASRTPGLVGADLENIAHESVLLAARRGGDFVTKKDVLEAVERATTKICNDDDDDSANGGKSAYLFGEESVHLGGRSMAF